jgi:hypothetical protein
MRVSLSLCGENDPVRAAFRCLGGDVLEQAQWSGSRKVMAAGEGS